MCLAERLRRRVDETDPFQAAKTLQDWTRSRPSLLSTFRAAIRNDAAFRIMAIGSFGPSTQRYKLNMIFTRKFSNLRLGLASVT